MKLKIFSLFLFAAANAVAQNPIIRDQFTADPTARVFNNKVYLYPSHDIVPSQGQRQDWFCMADYHVFSSENLAEWTDHGVILSQEQVPWGKPDGYSMWAPDCVEKAGKYYFYFPDAPREGRGFAIGVAVADSPVGPFVCEPEPIKGISGIDPCVLVDNDGKAYIYWSGMGIRGARLKANMKELEGKLTEVKMPRREGAPEMPPVMMGGEEMKGLPEGFKEGPFAFRRGDWYYLTFPWVRKEKGTETLAYAMSKSPLGPWDFKGIFMAEHEDGCWTNHHSFVEYKGQWYLFYHHNDLSPNDDKRRSARIEKVTFNDDGTIPEIKPTLRGAGILSTTQRPKYFTLVAPKAAPSQPDERGFIRRWRMLEPIRQEIRSNVIFTDSWLRNKFAEELAKLTAKSQKPKSRSKWYTLDSETYNMKLFRFAEQYGKQTYGSLFWCETVIDSPEDIENVRLAVGSNGASMWWLNGVEVLLLEGDRRMVEDDGVSHRLTLKKGRNLLRGAIINGPGLSDMCVRFIDEKGQPVTTLKIEH